MIKPCSVALEPPVSRTIFCLIALMLFSFFVIPEGGKEARGAEEQRATDHAQITLAIDDQNLRKTGAVHVALFQTLEEGWHTYWRNPGDSGVAAKIHWSTAPNLPLAEKDIRWSTPEKIPVGPFMNFGYGGESVLLQTLVFPPESLPDTPVLVNAQIDLLVCRDLCIPETHMLSFSLPQERGDAAKSAKLIEEAGSSFPDEKGWETRVWEDNEGNLVVFIDDKEAQALRSSKDLQLFPEEWGLIDNTKETKLSPLSAGEGPVVLTHPRGERALHDVPITKLVVTGQDEKGSPVAIRLSALVQPLPASTEKASEDVPQEKAPSTPAFSGAPPSLPLCLLLAFLGGIILNLMPCVFPILSMKALSLVSLKDKEASKALKHGMAYTAGVFVTFTGVAGLLIALQKAGEQIGWGFQLQNPLMVLFLVYLFFVLGLNLLGYTRWNGGRMVGLGGRLPNKSGLTASFFTGVLSTFVATPCSAPFMGTAVGYALTQSPFVALPVFWSLGFGLAFPYLILCLLPALRHRLPRPGAWMETFRQFLAFPMLASGCWLLWVLTEQTGTDGLLAALCGLITTGFGLWLIPLSKGDIVLGPIRLFMILGAFSTTLWTFSLVRTAQESFSPADSSAQPPASASEINWLPFSETALSTAQENGQGVFVDMTAAWCITCKVNEALALDISQTAKLFSEKGIVALRGDWTSRDPALSRFLSRFGRSGVPLYLYFPPQEKGKGPPADPRILPQILTPAIVADSLGS